MTPQLQSRALDRSLARAVAWNAAARWIAQILSWASTIIVARILSPYDYGLIGMAGLYLNLAMLISQSGITDTIIVYKDLSHERVAQLNTVSLGIGLGLVGITWAVAYPLARFFSAPPLFAVLGVSSIWYIFSAFQVVPRGLLQKELRFSLLASLETVRAFFQAILTILFAWLGFRYWSLVIGYLGGAALVSVLVLYWRRHAFAWPRLRALRSEIKYSFEVLLSRVALYAYDNSDFAVAGRVLGAAPLGDYTVAWTISSAPVEKISNLITGVTPAYFSAVQEKQAELRRYLLRITEILSYVTIPASLGLALSADFLVPVLLGPKWVDAIGPLRLLAIFVAFRSITTILPILLTSTGRAGFVMKATVAAAILMPFAFYLGSRWGTVGIAAAWVIAYPLITAPLLRRTLRVTGLHVREYLATIAPPLNASLIMVLSVLLTRLLFFQNSRSIVGLLSIIVVAILAYGAALYVFYRERTRHMIVTAKSILRKEKNEQPS